MAIPKGETHQHQSERLDEALDESFPASDSPSVSRMSEPPDALGGFESDNSIVVRDNPTLQRFEMQVVRQMAVAEYRIAGDVFTFFHTEVPPAIEGKGMGSRLIEGALRQVRARGLKVVSRCSFVSHFLREHPEYGDLGR